MSGVVRASNDAFPVHLLEGCQTALMLFAAAFKGENDAVWILDAGLTATCVDINRDSLEEMRRFYPDKWEFVLADAFEFAGSTTKRWDVVCVDPFTNRFRDCANAIELWCRRARDVVLLATGTTTEVTAPDGWRIVDRRHRSDYAGGVYWDVLTRGTA